MEFGVYQFLADPVLIAFLILTAFSVIWKFFKVWIASIITCSLAGALIVVILVTAGQVAGADDLIRYLITSHYRFMGSLTLSFRDIILMLLLIISFQLALAGHTLEIEKKLNEHLFWIPSRGTHHYEMEHTLEGEKKSE
ncbi:MAG TPA: hypothetical protein VN429_09370 [Methanospirillum sp.]|uniref:hypothetical protein n=1 Tax=Methanospirillum sp. TaxID=45200 RepID=UPI002C6EB195|nr:hypothetical protein [Methanospirillum sp.]HWQ64612.1 hypothetical protein [Methanospirillum sp.]